MNAALMFALLATTASAQELAGDYVFSVHELASELLLKPNGAFEFGLTYGAADYSAHGAWRADNGFVVLTSEVPKSPAFRLLNSSAGQSKNVRVWIKGPGGQAVEHIGVVLRTAAAPGADTASQDTDQDGLAEFAGASSPRAVSFHVAVYEFDAGPFEVNRAHNEFTFEINGDAITQVPFKGERLRIDGRVLELSYWNKEHPMRFEKQGQQ